MTGARPQLAVLGQPDDELLAELAAVGEVTPISAIEDPKWDAVLAGIDGLLVVGQQPVDRALLERCPRLRVLSVRAVGYDRVDIDACTARGVQVCNTPGVLDEAVAELALLLMLAWFRRLPEAQARAGVRPPGVGAAQPLGHDLAGKRLGIVGMGRIGRRVARIAEAFQIEVAYSSRGDQGGYGSWTRLPEAELLHTSDILSLHLPLTAETRGFIGMARLKQMKPTSLLVNTARGALVNERDLVTALEDGLIAGAALDVVDAEPISPDHPLLQLPNALITPHVGSATVETRRAMGQLAVTNLANALSGAGPVCRVNELG